jgi:hypothetical protein
MAFDIKGKGNVALDPANFFGQRTNQSRDQVVGQMMDPLGLFGNKKGSSYLGPSGYEVEQQAADARFRQPKAPQRNENLSNIMKAQTEQANAYRKEIPQSVKRDSDMLYGDYQRQARNELANKIKGTRASFNARGLLNSGMRAGSEMMDRGQSESDLAATRMNINKSLLDARMNAANSMEQNALNTGYSYAGSSPSLGAGALYGSGLDQAGDIYNSQLQQEGLNQLGSNVGNLAGTIYANRNRNKRG